MLVQTLTQETSQLEANLCSAFADPTRIHILYALNKQPRNVTELAHDLGSTQPTMSRHLKILRDHGLVQTTRQGVSITYTLADTRLIKALDILRTILHDNLTANATLVGELNTHLGEVR